MRNENNTLILDKSNVKTVSFAVGIPVGSSNEITHGCTSLISTHIQRNTQKNDEQNLSKILDKLGINIFSHVSRTNFIFGMNLPPKNLEEGFKIFTEILLEPEFKEDTLEKIKQQTMGSLQQIQSTANSMLTNYTRWKATYLNDPITKHPDGDLDSLTSINLELLNEAYSDLFKYSPKFVAVGLNTSEVEFNNYGLESFLNNFGTKKNNNSIFSSSKIDLNVVQDKIAVPTSNAYIGINMRSLGNETSNYQDEIFHAVLSGGMSSRMFVEIRENRNLSYNPHVINSKFSKGGFMTLLMDVRPDRADEALDTTLKLIDDTLKQNIPKDEMERAIKTAQKIFVFVSDSSKSYTTFLISKIIHNQEWRFDKLKQKIEEVTKTNWQEDLLKFWNKRNVSLSIAGDSELKKEKFQQKAEEYIL